MSRQRVQDKRGPLGAKPRAIIISEGQDKALGSFVSARSSSRQSPLGESLLAASNS